MIAFANAQHNAHAAQDDAHVAIQMQRQQQSDLCSNSEKITVQTLVCFPAVQTLFWFLGKPVFEQWFFTIQTLLKHFWKTVVFHC